MQPLSPAVARLGSPLAVDRRQPVGVRFDAGLLTRTPWIAARPDDQEFSGRSAAPPALAPAIDGEADSRFHLHARCCSDAPRCV